MKKFAVFARLGAAYKNKSQPEQLRIVARDSWSILVAATILLIIFCAGCGVWKVFDVSKTIARAQNHTVVNATVSIDQSALDAATQALQGRANAFGILTSAPSTSTIADPSK